MAVLALDLGGTKLAGALLAENGKKLIQAHHPLEGRGGKAVGELVRRQVALLIDGAKSRGLQVDALGVSVPGISHAKTGTVWAPNIPGWEAYPLRRELQSSLGRKALPIMIDNDRACSLLGETWKGRAKGCRHAIFLAIGTGIGAGIMVDGRVLRGAQDIAGSIGWLALDRPYRREYVACGCFEYHASGEGLAKVARELRGNPPVPPWTAHDVFAALSRGDRIARAVLAQAVEFWGMAVANLVSLFNPEKIIFGGGVFGPAARFLGDIRAEASKWAQPIAIRKVRLQVSKLGAGAALYGAGYLATQAVSNRRVR